MPRASVNPAKHLSPKLLILTECEKNFQPFLQTVEWIFFPSILKNLHLSKTLKSNSREARKKFFDYFLKLLRDIEKMP